MSNKLCKTVMVLLVDSHLAVIAIVVVVVVAVAVATNYAWPIKCVKLLWFNPLIAILLLQLLLLLLLLF